LITLINARSKDSQCKNNSNREQVVRNYTKKGRTSNIPSIFNFNPFVNKCFIICFTIFSILLPIGIQPQLESNYVFAEIDSQMTNDEVEYSDDENSSLSSTSESKSNLNVKNPFGSTGDNNKKVKTNILSLEKTTSTESSLTSSSQSAQAESSNEVYGDFNGDGFDDLAIGVAAEDLGSIFNADAGGVEVIYGSSNGLSATSAHTDQFWTQDSANIDNQAESSDLRLYFSYR
jgi:FG-GAP repeat protein